MTASAALRLHLDSAALQSNWRWLEGMGGAPAGAAIKADGYGLGAREVMGHLAAAGCRDFFVSSWAEAEALGPIPAGVRLSVLHGVREADMAAALSSDAVPVLVSAAQVARWREAAPERACDVMVDTAMNRLGLGMDELHLLGGLRIGTFMSHLASGDEDGALNRVQRERFLAASAMVTAERHSLANSAGICLGADYGFDLTRPGLALYGGIPRAEAEGKIVQVARPEAAVLQRRTVRAGETVGYNATWTATRDTEAATLNIGYADGYLRCFTGKGVARVGDVALPLIGRVSMDLVVVDCSALPSLGEGDWVALDYDLPQASALSGLSQYELLTGLSPRFERTWA